MHHHLDQSQADLIALCQNVCGVQAQVMSAAEMALWARRHDLKREDIHSALWENRTLVKTSCMRQTLHLLPAIDFSIYISALKKSRVEALLRIMSKFGVTQKDAEAMNATVMEILAAGPLTQRELTDQIKPQVGKKVQTWMEHVWSVFRPAIVEGLICYGPNRGQEATFVRVDQWLPKQKEVSEKIAQQILLRRYLSAYGPATVQDFSKWSGIPMKEAKGIGESLEGELVNIHFDDKKVFVLREDYDQLINGDLDHQILRLLPGFDPYLLGHAEKDHLVNSSDYKRVYRNQGWISPVILLNGRVIGTWSHHRRAKQSFLEIEPFENFSKTIRNRIAEEAESLGNFLKASWEIKFSK